MAILLVGAGPWRHGELIASAPHQIIYSSMSSIFVIIGYGCYLVQQGIRMINSYYDSQSPVIEDSDSPNQESGFHIYITQLQAAPAPGACTLHLQIVRSCFTDAT